MTDLQDTYRQGGPAFPEGVHPGMTLRDWFAGQMLSGHAASDTYGDVTFGGSAEAAYKMADAMLEARGVPRPQTAEVAELVRLLDECRKHMALLGSPTDDDNTAMIRRCEEAIAKHGGVR